MNQTLFGTMPDGTPVDQYTLSNGTISCDIITYGGAIRSIRVPDKAGNLVDVALGFDTLEDYRRQDKYIGALIGRYANRIGGASFDLNGVHYPLAANDGTNHLHGGMVGFDKRVWTVEEVNDSSLTLSLVSPDGEEGYPGKLQVRVTYLLEEQSLEIHYWALCDQDTVCNLTNHVYLNLSGHESGEILDQTIQIAADQYTPTDPASIPNGEIADVGGTPMDLRKAVPMGEQIDAAFPQLAYAGGYDHNWVLRGGESAVSLAAVAHSPRTGITMETYTDQPGIQFYSGNYLDGCPQGKKGAPYAKRWGFCLEAQRWPDSPHHQHFPSPILRAGEEYRQTTVYRFR